VQLHNVVVFGLFHVKQGGIGPDDICLLAETLQPTLMYINNNQPLVLAICIRHQPHLQLLDCPALRPQWSCWRQCSSQAGQVQLEFRQRRILHNSKSSIRASSSQSAVNVLVWHTDTTKGTEAASQMPAAY
jgi:hypothetical protein